MKTTINKPRWSKINWTALVMFLIGLGVTFNVIPEEYEKQVTDAALMVMPLLIMAFRTWFTEPKPEIGP